MIENLIKNELLKIKVDLNFLYKTIDCVTVFPKSEEEYRVLNNEMRKKGQIIDKMQSGNLYYVPHAINTIYGHLYFVKVRKFDSSYLNYYISVDFTVENFYGFKKSLINPYIKKYDTFELIQLKNENSIINVVSLSAKHEYKEMIEKFIVHKLEE